MAGSLLTTRQVLSWRNGCKSLRSVLHATSMPISRTCRVLTPLAISWTENVLMNPGASLHTTPHYSVQPSQPCHIRRTEVTLAGHSKWQNIRHIKGAKDAQKASLNSRYVKEINNAIREGNGPDPKFNVVLARVIARAEKDDVPKLTLQNVLKRAKEGKPRVTQYYDMRGPGNTALIIETFTDSLPKTKNNLTAACKRLGGRLGDSNQFFFDKKGMIYIPAEGLSFEQAEELAIEAGAEEIEEDEELSGEKLYKLVCSDEELFMVKKILEVKNVSIIRYETEFVPTTLVTISEEAQATLVKLLEKIESIEEVVKIYDNIEVE